MRKISILFFTALLCFNIANSQIGIGTQTPDSSAQLDVFSIDKGFLPPRVMLVATNTSSPVVNPATGLLVYNNATAGFDSTAITPGYYYWNGLSWQAVVNKANTFGDMQYWDGTKWIIIPIGSHGQVLTVCNGIPQWGPCNTTLILQPSQNQYEGFVDNFYPDIINNGTQQLDMAAWTAGPAVFQRTFIKFDFSSVPADAIVDSARLYLYATTSPTQGGNGNDPHSGSNNSCSISRITTPWSSPAQFTWSNQPSFSTSNQAFIPQSTSAIENNTIDVTLLIKDMLVFGNNGFHIRLQNEVTYNIRQYASSRHPDNSRHPKLVIYYH